MKYHQTMRLDQVNRAKKRRRKYKGKRVRYKRREIEHNTARI